MFGAEGEELAPAISIFESRPEPGWRSGTKPVQSASAGEMPEQVRISVDARHSNWFKEEGLSFNPCSRNFAKITKPLPKRGTSCRGRRLLPWLVVILRIRRSPFLAGTASAEKVGQKCLYQTLN